MYLSDLANRGNIPVLEKVLAYVEARHKMLANNIANINTPGYKAKQLDTNAFQAALRRAVDERGNDPHKRLEIDGTEEFHLDDRGHLVVRPSEEPVHNILFHDRTNARIEVQMAQLAENVMMYNMATELLRGSFDGLKKAIRGQV